MINYGQELKQDLKKQINQIKMIKVLKRKINNLNLLQKLLMKTYYLLK